MGYTQFKIASILFKRYRHGMLFIASFSNNLLIKMIVYYEKMLYYVIRNIDSRTPAKTKSGAIPMKIYVCDIAQMYDLSGCELLAETRLTRLKRYLRFEDQVRCLVAGLMLRCVLGSNSVLDIHCSPYGKPYLPYKPFFNLSHSGKKVVLVLDTQEVGVDIELIEPYSEAIAKRVFTKKELDWLHDQENDRAFFKLWTGKESIIKATGLGFQLPPESFEIQPTKNRPNLVDGRIWFLTWQELDEHMLCVAGLYPHKEMEIVHLRREDLLFTQESK